MICIAQQRIAIQSALGNNQDVGGWHRELAVHQIRRPGRVGVGLGGADLLGLSDPVPAIGPHQALHGTTGHLDALPVKVGPYLVGAVEVSGLRRPCPSGS